MKFYCFLQGAWYDRKKPIRQVYDEIVAEAQLAEGLGYDGVWLAEQNLVTFLATPDPVQMAVLVAERTKRIRIGLGVIVLPFHHPLRVAGEVSQLDVLTNGRIDVGVGRGASPYQLRQFQKEMDDETSRRYFAEQLDIITRHWTTTDREQSFDGEFFKYPAATVLPSPVQKPYPPLWIAALSPQSTEWAIRLGHQSNHLNSPFREPFSWVERVYRSFEATLKDVGRLRSSSQFGINRMTNVAETVEEARKILPLVQRGHRVVAQQVNTKQEFIKDGEYITDKPVPNEPSLDEMFSNTLMGTPDMVYEKVKAYYDLGVDHVSTWHHIGQDHKDVCRSMTLFANHIMPDFKSRNEKVGAAA
jgi:alkanesulfonate monooxygenase SsuD/methylene tetrahydromethanopterin reductase-like flavin-dependent oxidoreductase (luciferase family)